MNSRRANQFFVNNLLWLLASLLVAFWVWFVATTQANPIQVRTFSNIPVQIEPPEGILVIDAPTRTVRVNVRSQSSILNSLTAEDVVVRVNLDGLSPGTHTIPLEAEVARNTLNTLAETQPTQLTVILELIQSEQKEVTLTVENPPPTDFSFDPPSPDVLQVQIQGAASAISEVVTVEGSLDLSDQRNPVEIDVRLSPIDAEGNRVENVELTPQTTRVSVDIFQRDDVRQVSVRPQILVETLPQGYMLSTISYEPQTIFVSGTPRQLEQIDNTFFTSPIFLTEQTSGFDITVPIEFPEDISPVVSGDDSVTVTVGIVELTTVRQFDNIPIEVIGIGSDLDSAVTIDVLSVVLNGPISVLDNITEDDIQAIVDLNGLAAGNYEVEPLIFINQDEVFDGSITVLPPTISVLLTSTQPTPLPNTPGFP